MADKNKNGKMIRMKNRIAHAILAIHIAAAATLFCGCQVLTYTSPTGEHLARGCLGSNIAISALTVETDTNGVRRVELHGYQNDSAQALGAVTDAAVRAAIQSAK